MVRSLRVNEYQTLPRFVQTPQLAGPSYVDPIVEPVRVTSVLLKAIAIALARASLGGAVAQPSSVMPLQLSSMPLLHTSLAAGLTSPVQVVGHVRDAVHV